MKTCPAPFPANEATWRSVGLASPVRVKGYPNASRYVGTVGERGRPAHE